MQLVTHQTGPAGRIVTRVLVEEGLQIDARAVPRPRDRPLDAAAGVMVSPDGGVEIEKVAEETPETNLQGVRPSRAGPAAVRGATSRVRPRPLRRSGRQGRQADDGHLSGVHRDRRLAPRDQPARRHGGRRAAGARRQDELRRQRALSPSGSQGTARPRRGRAARDRGVEVLAQLHQARRHDRLHGQRRRPRDGDDGHHQAGGRGAGQLPGRRRRRQRRADQERVPHPDVGHQPSRPCSSTSSAASCAATCSPQGVIAAVKDLGVRVPIVIRMEGTNVELGKQMLKESGLNFTTADSMADAAAKVVAAGK